jgi:aspartate aminotransferase
MPLSGEVRKGYEALRPFLAAMLDPELQAAFEAPDVCDFLVGNPEEPSLPGYVEALQKWAVPEHRRWFAYGFGHPAAQRAAAEGLSAELGLPFEPDDILLTRGAHGALAMAMHLVVDPGDEVVFVSPPWFFYEVMILSANATPVRVRADMTTFDLDLDAIAAALTARTKMVLVNTPNNPTGRIYPAETLERLASILEQHALAVGHDVYLLSDESYSKVLYDGNRMISPARWYANTFLVHTYSKSSLAPGQRVGYVALPPDMHDRQDFREGSLLVSVATGNGFPDAIMQYALPDIEGIVLDTDRLQRKRDRMLGALRSFGYDVRTPEGTFYLLPRCPQEDDLAWCRLLAREHVAVLPGSACEMPGYFRISLTGTDDMVERALPVFERMVRVDA